MNDRVTLRDKNRKKGGYIDKEEGYAERISWRGENKEIQYLKIIPFEEGTKILEGPKNVRGDKDNELNKN